MLSPEEDLMLLPGEGGEEDGERHGEPAHHRCQSCRFSPAQANCGLGLELCDDVW